MESVLEAIWQYIQAHTWQDVVRVTSIFLLSSFGVIWLVACLLARIPWPVREDAELKVHLGVLITLSFFLLIIQSLIIMVALHAVHRATVLDHITLFLGLVITIFAFILVFGLSKLVQTKLDKIRKRRPIA